MALPSIAIRLEHLRVQLDQLLGWSGHMPDTRQWQYQINELRFVRATLAWEEFLEQSFICYLRGSQSSIGRSYALSVPAVPNRNSAIKLAIGDGPFGKWLNERWTLGRADKIFSGPHPYALLSSPRFPEIRAIRNRIVHRSEGARTDFQRIIMSICGTARPGMTPGRFLSESSNGIVRIEFYLHLVRESGSLVAQ